MPEQPDFLLTGDFDADGHLDVVAAHRGGNTLYLMRGDGHGGLRPAKNIPVSGSITAMIAGEINRADGLTDLIVAIKTANEARVLVYESPRGALAGTPEAFRLSAPVNALALGKFDGNAMNDLAIASGNQFVVIHARDRKLSQDETTCAAVPRAKVTVEELSFAIRTLIAGDFTGTGASVAALDEAGKIHILEHAVSESSFAAKLLNNSDVQPTFQLPQRGPDGKLLTIGGRMTPSTTAKIPALRESVRNSDSATEWTERSTVTLPGGFSQATPRLASGRINGSLEEDIIAIDSGNRQVHVLSTGTNSPQNRAAALARRRSGSGNLAVTPMKVIASMEAESTPAVVLPMRLNRHGLNGLVTLHIGQAEPTIMPQDIPPANVFTVTNTSDSIIKNGIDTTGPAGSLRKAMDDANHASGASEIVFNIPTTDPGYNSATGTFLIQPLSESVPGALNNFALPPINATMTIDGYTQPGASPNTLPGGDNARILIQIDGSKATTPGGAGLVPFDDVGSVFRGLDFTGWTNPEISSGSNGGSTASGAEGIEANGVQDFIEGNFFGTDPTGKVAAPNRIGVFADNGPGFGSTAGGNIIGGTTPQARNILSGNNNSGVLFLSTALEAQLQGNFIGLDITGKGYCLQSPGGGSVQHLRRRGIERRDHHHRRNSAGHRQCHRRQRHECRYQRSDGGRPGRRFHRSRQSHRHRCDRKSRHFQPGLRRIYTA